MGLALIYRIFYSSFIIDVDNKKLIKTNFNDTKLLDYARMLKSTFIVLAL